MSLVYYTTEGSSSYLIGEPCSISFHVVLSKMVKSGKIMFIMLFTLKLVFITCCVFIEIVYFLSL